MGRPPLFYGEDSRCLQFVYRSFKSLLKNGRIICPSDPDGRPAGPSPRQKLRRMPTVRRGQRSSHWRFMIDAAWARLPAGDRAQDDAGSLPAGETAHPWLLRKVR